MIHTDVCFSHVSFRARAKMVNRCHWMNFWQRQRRATLHGKPWTSKSPRHGVYRKPMSIWHFPVKSIVDAADVFFCRSDVFFSRRNGPTPNFFVFLQLVAKKNEILWRTFQPVVFCSSSSILRRLFLNVRVEYRKRLFLRSKSHSQRRSDLYKSSKFQSVSFEKPIFGSFGHQKVTTLSPIIMVQ